MSTMDKLLTAFAEVSQRFDQSGALQKIAAGTITVAHYKAYLRQVFHHTRENPQLQTLATVFFRGSQRTSIKKFFKHATSEIGHDELALNDLRYLGDDVSGLPEKNPLPATTALLAFPFYQIYNRNPVGYLGYLFFLEFLPTSQGARYMELFTRAGVPREAMTFLHDHSTIDIGHNKLMEAYVDELITTEHELSSVIYSMHVTGELYSNMVASAFEDADSPLDYGVDCEELPRFEDRPLAAGTRLEVAPQPKAG